MAKAKTRTHGNGTGSALAKLDPATRAAVVSEVLAALQHGFDIWDKPMNHVSTFRKVAESFGVPYLVLRFALEEATDVAAEEWPVNQLDALAYAEWIGQHGKGAE